VNELTHVAATPTHHGEPLSRDRAELGCLLVKPSLDSRIAFDCSSES
jgi:hypothetical protein